MKEHDTAQVNDMAASDILSCFLPHTLSTDRVADTAARTYKRLINVETNTCLVDLKAPDNNHMQKCINSD